MHICSCSWALEVCKNIGIRTFFGSVTVESVRVFRHFAFCHHGFQLATFFIVHMNWIFLGTSFKLFKNLATLNPENRFLWNPPIPLLHPRLPGGEHLIGFWFLVCYAATHLADQLLIHYVGSKKLCRTVADPAGSFFLSLGKYKWCGVATSSRLLQIIGLFRKRAV